MRNFSFITWVIFLFCTSTTHGQGGLYGVYAGIEFRYTINGMETFYLSYYFRPDGTVCDELGSPDWQTRVDGRYTVSGKKITIVPVKGNYTTNMEMKYDYLVERGTLLFKYEVVNSMPAKTFFQQTDYGQLTEMSFDGNGHFTTAGFRGGSARQEKSEFDGEGTYTIQQSALTLHYVDGRVIKKSFFYGGGKQMAALINGSTYDITEKKYNGPSGKTEQLATDTGKAVKQKIKQATANTGNGMGILLNANQAHGGKALDNMTTLRLRGMAGKTSLTLLLDIVQQKIRIELYQGSELRMIEQLEGSNGWQWMKPRVTALTPSRIGEMQATFTTGVLGLRNNMLKKLSVQSTEADESTKTKTVMVTIGGQTYGWIFDEANRLLGEVSAVNGNKRVSQLKDFRTVDGVVLPFSTIETKGTQSFTLNYSSITINPVFTEKNWKKPD